MRLFVAIEAPPAWREAAAVVTAAIARASGVALRAVEPDRLHLTLRFLGEVAPEAVDGLGPALAATVPPVDIALAVRGAATFGPSARTSLVYLGVHEVSEGQDADGEEAALQALRARVEAALRTAGLPADPRPLEPHVTIARLQRSLPADARRAVAAAARTVAVPHLDAVRVREVVLVHSILGAMPRYEVLARIGSPTDRDT